MNREYRMGKVVRIDDLEIRTEEFALSIIELFTSLPKNVETQIIDKQVLRSGTSVGANWRLLKNFVIIYLVVMSYKS